MNKQASIFVGLVLFLIAFQVNASVCNISNQILPLTIDTGNTLQNLSATACNNDIFTINGALGNGQTTPGNFIISSLTNWNSLTNNGTINGYAGQLSNSVGASLVNNGLLNNGLFNSPGQNTIINSGTLSNSGTINNFSYINNSISGILTNYGAINSIGQGYGSLISNSGILINSSGATISTKGVDGGFNTNSQIINSGTLINNGEIIISYSSGIQNSGTLINNGVIRSTPGGPDSATGSVSGLGMITNNGTMNFDGLSVTSVDGTGIYTTSGTSYNNPSSMASTIETMTQEAVNIINSTMTVGTLNASIVNLSSTSTLNVTNANIGTFSSNGTTNISGFVNVDDVLGGTFGFQINGAALSEFSVLHVKNSANLLANSLNYLFSFNGYVPSLDEHWLFLTADNGFTASDTFNSTFSQKISNTNYLFSISALSSGLELRVAAVPEPDSYAMFLAGLGLLGFMIRRRKNEQAKL